MQERDETSALLLLRLQARPDTVDRLGLTPLFYAARDGNKRLVQALLAAGAYRSLRNCNSWIRQAHFMAEIRDPSIVAIIQSATVTCPRLTWLAKVHSTPTLRSTALHSLGDSTVATCLTNASLKLFGIVVRVVTANYPTLKNQ